jgi:mono/diheme cytochrome c family protein
MKNFPLQKYIPGVSRLSAGVMGLGGSWDQTPITADHIKQAHEVIDTALEVGINFFDHADIYMMIKAEQVFGQVLKERHRPPQGPGRVDTFNPYKRMFGFDMKADASVGTADLPPLFNQRPRQGLWLHWDGNNDLVEERNKSAAIGAGATETSIDLASLDRVAQWTLDLQPPPYPAARIDRAKAEQGALVYRAACASCHAFDGDRVGRVTPLAEIGTDPERVRSFTPELVAKMNTIGTGTPWQFSHFRKTDGYANMPLDGVWLRAPYLHNGSVPTLRALLFPDERPAIFHRGYDVYDWQRVGFVSDGPEAARQGVRFDTGLRGNSNAGHTYGRDLPAIDREALIEYLKTS